MTEAHVESSPPAAEKAPPPMPEAISPRNVEGEAPLKLTAKAIEMAKKAIDRRETPAKGLRLGVRGGGCSGVSYAIEFADKIRGRDNVFEFEGVNVVVDPKSLVYLRGSILDYEVKLMEHGFKFRNPNEKSSCGCGESFGI